MACDPNVTPVRYMEVISQEVMPAWRVLHRGDVVDEVIRGALERGERMERAILDEPQRLEFATQALALRLPENRPGAMTPSDLLRARRPEALGNDLWRCTASAARP